MSFTLYCRQQFGCFSMQPGNVELYAVRPVLGCSVTPLVYNALCGFGLRLIYLCWCLSDVSVERFLSPPLDCVDDQCNFGHSTSASLATQPVPAWPLNPCQLGHSTRASLATQPVPAWPLNPCQLGHSTRASFATQPVPAWPLNQCQFGHSTSASLATQPVPVWPLNQCQFGHSTSASLASQPVPAWPLFRTTSASLAT